MDINGKTRLHGIIGMPVAHSLSPIMHNAAFAALGMNGVYVPMEVVDVGGAIAGLKQLGFIGVSVTVPHKVSVMEHLDWIDPVAARIGAVNTVAFEREPDGGTVVGRGYNTDWLGSNIAMERELQLRGARVLVIGAGGAAKAVGFGLKEVGAEVVLTNRTTERGQQLADQIGCDFIAGDRLAGVRADVLVNTTSVGMEPHTTAVPIDVQLLVNFSVVMDIVYAPLQTSLLREARERGCRTVDGLAMLQHQGACQFEIWTGEQPPAEVMRQALIQALHHS